MKKFLFCAALFSGLAITSQGEALATTTGPIITTARIAVRAVEQTIAAANCRQCERQARRQARRADRLARIAAGHGRYGYGCGCGLAGCGCGSDGYSLKSYSSSGSSVTAEVVE